MKNLIFRIALRVVGSTIIFSPKLCGAVLMFTQMGWETTLTPTPPSFLPDCRMAVVCAMGRVVDPMANPIRFEELVQTISMDVAGGAELTTHFSRKFELVGDPETFARVTLEGFASGNVVATGTVFTAVFNGGVTNVLVGGPGINFALVEANNQQKIITQSPTDSGFLACGPAGSTSYTVTGDLDMMARPGGRDDIGKSLVDSLSEGKFLQVGVRASDCAALPMPEPGSMPLFASAISVLVLFHFRGILFRTGQKGSPS